MANNICPNIKPLSEWLEEKEADGECKPCSLSGLVGSYSEVLTDAGRPDLIEKINASLDDLKDPIGRLAKTFDEIKQQLPEDVQRRLQSCDCEAINFKK